MLFIIKIEIVTLVINRKISYFNEIYLHFLKYNSRNTIMLLV